MTLYHKVFIPAMSWILVIIFGVKMLLPFLWDMVSKGPRKVLHVKKRAERPTVLDNPELGIHKFARLGNIRLHYVESGPEGKPLMLFIHGFPEFWYSWRHQIREFSKDFRVVAMDMRGYSESEKPADIYAYSVDKLVDDVKDLIQYLGYEKAVVVAHDWGGAVAWSFAARYPEMVDKVIVCNVPFPTAGEKLRASSFQQILKSWYIFMFQWPIFPAVFVRALDMKFISDVFTGPGWGCQPGRITHEDMEAFKYTFQNYADIDCPVNYYRARFRNPVTDPRFKGRVTSPALMIWETNDLALGRELAEMSADYCDDYRVKYVEGASHWVQQDEPEIVNKHIREFVTTDL